MIKAQEHIQQPQTLANNWESCPPAILNRAKLCAVERNLPLELPLCVSIAAISTCLGKGLTVHTSTSRETRANLYFLLGVASGIGKSEVFRDLFSPILDYESNLHEWWQKEASPRARAGEELLKARGAQIRSVVRKLASPTLSCFRELQEAESQRDICRGFLEAPCLLADDATPEALAEIMSRSNESVAMVSADARHLLKRLSVADSKEENMMLKAFSGDLTLTSRVSRKAARLRSPCLTTLLLTQRDAYHRFIEKAQANRSGLLPRFLHIEFSAEINQLPQIDRRKAPTIKTGYQDLLANLIESFQFNSTPDHVTPSKEAAQFLKLQEIESRHNAAQDESIHGEILRRKVEQTWRVALCLHASRHGKLACSEELSLNDVNLAATFVEKLT